MCNYKEKVMNVIKTFELKQLLLCPFLVLLNLSIKANSIKEFD